MTHNQFFQKQWFRSELTEALGMKTDNYNENKLSFNDLRLQLATKLFGEAHVQSKAFKKDWILCEIKTLSRCIERDQLNYNNQTKAQQRRSALPTAIANDKIKLGNLQTQYYQL